MARTINFGRCTKYGMNERFMELINWVCAVDAWDYGDGSLLANLITSEEQVPLEFKQVLGDIISGARKQLSAKAAIKLEVPAAERMRTAVMLSILFFLIDAQKHGKVEHKFSYPQFVSEYDDVKPKDTEEVIDWLDENKRGAIQDAANKFNVSSETIENLVRELRKKAKKWPIV